MGLAMMLAEMGAKVSGVMKAMVGYNRGGGSSSDDDGGDDDDRG